MNLDNLFSNLLTKAARSGLVTKNLYKLFISRDLMFNALVYFELIDKNISIEELDNIFSELQDRWLRIKDYL